MHQIFPLDWNRFVRELSSCTLAFWVSFAIIGVLFWNFAGLAISTVEHDEDLIFMAFLVVSSLVAVVDPGTSALRGGSG